VEDSPTIFTEFKDSNIHKFDEKSNLIWFNDSIDIFIVHHNDKKLKSINESVKLKRSDDNWTLQTMLFYVYLVS
jgi:hypothetical protein